MALWQLIHYNIYIIKISCLVEEQIRLNKLNQKHGPSSWLASLLLAEEGYLIKQLFWGFVRIGFDLSLTRLPAYCERSGIFDFQYVLPGKKRCLCIITTQPSKKNNILTFKDIRNKEQLQPLTDESFTSSTATGNQVGLGVCTHVL